MNIIRWGILSTANIGRTKLIPALQSAPLHQVLGICSRSEASARAAADEMKIERAYGSYEALLADPDIDAIYNPLPNHLHVDWTIKALEAGKHVLCEKPIGMDSADTERLIAAVAKFPQLKVMEAFMYRFHPQWQTVKPLVENDIGKLRQVHSHFAYNNRDAGNIRNSKDMGGGALLDIGCYCISVSRWMFNAEPRRVMAQITPFEGQEVDCLASGILEFAEGSASFTVSTKIEWMQYMEAFGEAGSVFVPLPFSPPIDKPTQIIHKRDNEQNTIDIIGADHYREMGNAFALSIINNTPVPTPLSDALANMNIIDAMFQSAAESRWVNV